MLLYILIVAYILLLIINKFYRAQARGFIGEKYVSHYLKKLPEKDYLVLNNVMLKNGDASSQIDHVVISIYGVFVIETKNYSGWIYGNEYSEQWTKSFFGHKTKFMNPIRQNYGHMKALEQMFKEYKEFKMISIIAFSGDADLKVKNLNTPVVYYSKIVPTILSYKDKILSYNDMYAIKTIISDSNIDSFENRKEHVHNIKNNIKTESPEIVSHPVSNINSFIELESTIPTIEIPTEKNINNNDFHKVCTLCGSNMIYKKGRYGPFWACCKYPECKHTEKIIKSTK